MSISIMAEYAAFPGFRCMAFFAVRSIKPFVAVGTFMAADACGFQVFVFESFIMTASAGRLPVLSMKSKPGLFAMIKADFLPAVFPVAAFTPGPVSSAMNIAAFMANYTFF
jgi:hypothetical protein